MLEAGNIRIPFSRIGVLIGTDGNVKSKIEEMGNVKIEIDSESATVTVYQKDDAIKALMALNCVQAIARGFNPEKAMLLFNENSQLIIISIKEFVNKDAKRIKEVRGRLIGKSGHTRGIIEELTGTYLSISGNTVSIIGDYISIQYAREAVNMILQGRKHKTVYAFLEKNARDLKFKKMDESFGQ
ncbi:MAG: RNA-processing protein [Ferroplasma sp.]